jgi:hypothetical protein
MHVTQLRTETPTESLSSNRRTYSVNFDTLLERLSVFAHPLEGVRTLSLEPHALHLVQVLHGRHALAGELLTHLFGIGHTVGKKHVLCASEKISLNSDS